MRLRVKYGDDEHRYMSLFERGRTVGDFLDFVRAKMRNDSLCAVLRDGVRLPLEDMFDTWCSPEAIFHLVSENLDPVPQEAPHQEEDQRAVVIIRRTARSKPIIVRATRTVSAP